jgi:hypothetical protein
MLLMIFIVYAFFNFQSTLQTTYLSIYLVKALNINVALIAVFPAVSSIAMLVFLFFVIPRFHENKANHYIIGGFALGILSNVILITSAPGSILLVILSTLVAAAGTMTAGPYLEALVANSLDDEQRAKMLSILQVFVLLFVSPSGLIGGWTYSLDPRLPFILVIAAFTASIALMIGVGNREEKIRGKQKIC